jgi:hypothetical protein
MMRERPLIVYIDNSDVYEDICPHCGVDQNTFATQSSSSGNHAFLYLLQREVGDVVWYSFSLKPELFEVRHEVVGCRVKMWTSFLLHRCLWRTFYLPRMACRWNFAYRPYATLASYVALEQEALEKAVEYCLSEEARGKAKECRDRAIKMVQEVCGQFVSALTNMSEKMEN